MSKWLLFTFCLLFSACSGRKTSLSFNLVSESVQLDWHKANDSSSAVILDNIMEGLSSYAGALQANQQGEGLRPIPALAASWAISQGGRVYRFHLRENVRWNDGVLLTAQQFVDSWQRLLDPATKSGSAYHLFDIAGAREFASGETKDFSKVGVRAIDDRTLEVELRRPAPYFLHLLATPATFPIRLDLLKKFGSSWASPQNLVTLGPYTLEEWSPGERIVLNANRTYWEEAPPISTVICKMISEPLTALSLYLHGDLDILPRDLPVSHYDFWQGHPDYRTGTKLSVSYLAFNVRKAPFNRVEARRAFAKLVNRQALAKFFKGAQTPTSSFIPPGMFGYMPSIGIGFEANAKASNWSNIRIKYNASDTLNLVFQTLQSELRHEGSQPRLEAVDWKDYKELLSGLSGHTSLSSDEQPHVFYVGWVADFPDPHAFMNIFTSASENNYTGWTNPRYDALVEAAVETENESRRAALYEQAQRILLEEEVVILPLFFSSHQALVKANIKGIVLNSLDKWYFKNIRFEP